MIHFISGKPRGGKSLYAFMLIINELLYGSRIIMTNLPIKRPELNAYLQERYPDKQIDLFDRLIILSDDETKVFWTIRPNGFKIEPLTELDWKSGKRPSFAGRTDTGVFYVIDEIHNFFNARAWAETGRDVLFYLSQHAKLSDTLICVTQHIGNVDKQFRSVTQDYTYLRNISKEKMGIFRLPGIFVRQTYLQPATDTSKPMESGTFRLDVSGLAACYDTSQGVGIHGKAGADKLERRRGVPWWVGVAGGLLLVYLLFQHLPKLIAWATSPRKPVSVHAAPSAGVQPNPSPGGAQPPGGGSALPPLPDTITNRVPKVTGFIQYGRRMLVTLDTGRSLDSDRGDLARTLDGKWIVLDDTPWKLDLR